MPNALDYMARRAEADPFYLGSALARYRDARALTDADLCRLLGCGAETLRSLKLCRRPQPETNDLGVIAAHYGIDPGALGRLLAPVAGAR
jgi:hypothetical protein